MDELELQRLAIQAASGDVDAVDDLFLKLHGPLMAHLYVLRIPRVDVEDVAQEAALQVYRSLEHYQSSRDFWPWVRGITAHVAGNYWREREQVRKEETLFRQILERKFEQGREPAWWDTWLRTGLMECLDRLQPRQRQLVSLRYIEDQDSARIGMQLSMKASAVRMALARIRDVLRACLEGGGR